MCALKKICLSIIIVFLTLTTDTNAQYQNSADSLKDNEYDVYEMIVFQKGDTGTFTKKFEYNIFVKQSAKQKTIEEYLTGIKKSKSDDKLKKQSGNGEINFSIGSGVSAPTLYTNSAYNVGINIQLNAMKVMSNGYAVRGDLQYSHNTPARQYEYVTEGDLNTYAMKLNFLLGNFRKTSVVNGYAILGGGLNISKRSETKFTFPEYNSVTMTYTGRNITYSQNYKAESFINLDCGGGLSYKIKDKYKLYAEAQYTFPVIYMGRYGGPIIYGMFFGSPSVRIGAQIEL
ncbi:MAG: hypothetical protein ABI462_08115 [Ignavibacteria bacterium]